MNACIADYMGDGNGLAAGKETDESTNKLKLVQCCKSNAMYEYRVNTCRICTFSLRIKRTERAANAEKERKKEKKEEEKDKKGSLLYFS